MPSVTGPSELGGAVTEITAADQAERQVRQSETDLRQVLDLTPTHITEFGPDGTRLYNNRAALEYHGMTLEEWQGAVLESLLHPQDAERLRREQPGNFLSGVPFEVEARLRRSDGQCRWFLARFNPMSDEQGHPTRWYAAATDIEDRKQAEDKLRRSEAFLLEAQAMSHTGSWRHNLVTGELTVSPEVLRMRGMPPDFKPGSIEFFFVNMHPDDRSRVREVYERAQIDRQDFVVDYRILLQDGTVRYMHTVGHPLLSETGELLEFTGTGIELTEQVEARIKLEKALEEIRRLKDRLQDENLALREEVAHASMFEEIVGSSAALRATLTSITMVAPTDSTVLISGETGTGKELIARAIHKRSRRAERAFVSVNCAAIPPALIASELFGHEKGAFTGATQQRRGRFELAHQGTIFLDEIGEIPLETQLALLRVLQERQFDRVGGGEAIPVDVRILAATNRDLSAAVAAGSFRSDLFYRLNVFPVDVPPLRQRGEDVPLLLEYFAKRFGDKMGKRIRGIERRTVELCRAYAWPGNIRELQNIVERSVILCTGDTLSVDEAWLVDRGTADRGQERLPEALLDQEKTLIEAALARSRGKVAGTDGAAATLGIPASTLESKIRQLKIAKRKFTGAQS